MLSHTRWVDGLLPPACLLVHARTRDFSIENKCNAAAASGRFRKHKGKRLPFMASLMMRSVPQRAR
jgi:hypothetical protein